MPKSKPKSTRFELVATTRVEVGRCGHSHRTRSEALACNFDPGPSDLNLEIRIKAI